MGLELQNWESILDATALPMQFQRAYIWGAGNTAALAHQGMLREGLYERFNVAGYIDNTLAGTTLNGLPVYAPDVLDADPSDKPFVLICTGNQNMLHEIESELNGRGVAHCLLDAAIMAERRSKLHEAAALLDSYSQSVYRRVLAKRLSLDPVEQDLYAGESYFGIPEFCLSSPKDVMLDCGAYVGDSAERFIWRMEQYQRIVSFEPDLGNFRALEKRYYRLRHEWNLTEEKLQAIFAGVDEKTSMLSVDTRVGGLGSLPTAKEGNGENQVVFWSIDDYVANYLEKTPPTYIKADIESFEYRMLLGARKTIEKYHPRLAICVYHNAVDMYSVPLLIRDINPDYKFAVRHHSYGLAETVLYAY